MNELTTVSARSEATAPTGSEAVVDRNATLEYGWLGLMDRSVGSLHAHIHTGTKMHMHMHKHACACTHTHTQYVISIL